MEEQFKIKEILNRYNIDSFDVNAKNNDGDTALMEDSINGRLEAVKYLISKGADVNAKNNDGNTALMWASNYGYLEIVEYLKSHGAK